LINYVFVTKKTTVGLAGDIKEEYIDEVEAFNSEFEKHAIDTNFSGYCYKTIIYYINNGVLSEDNKLNIF